MIRKALAGLIGVTALAASVVACIVSGSMALYFALEPGIGRAGAAALVSLVFALLLIIAGLLTAMRGANKAEEPDLGLMERLVGAARERPLMSAAAAVAASIIAFRNPALVATIVAAFMDRSKHER